MKLFLLILSVISATSSVNAATSPGAYDKLRRMFDSSNGSIKVSDVHAMATKVKECASATQAAPDEIYTAAKIISVSYSSQGFGPDFPSTTYSGIALNSSVDQIRVVGEDFFAGYREVVAPNELQLSTTLWYKGEYCYKDEDGYRTCDDITKTQEAELVIRMTSKYLLYKSGDAYAYCWQ